MIRTATPATKRCPRCHVTKPAAEFSRNARAYDALRSYCRPCDRLMRLAYRSLGTVIVRADPNRINPASMDTAPTVRVGHINLPDPEQHDHHSAAE